MPDVLPSRLDPKAIEESLYKQWSERGYFHANAEDILVGGKPPFVVVIPPPNVTAVLHMGHGLNNTIQDVLIRWKRMQGHTSLWVPGTDHAGIATQNVVERQLSDQGVSRHDLGREEFVEKVWSYVRKTGGQILGQLKLIGASCDWERTRFTLDEGLNHAVREVFVRLYEKDLIYRGEYIINWCPRCLTALSNEEAEGKEVESRIYHLRYPLKEDLADVAKIAKESGANAIGQLLDGRWYLTVSTTRPETMFGDTAVAVNPKDMRYSDLIGGSVEIPLAGRFVPIIADDVVDPEFGSGMVKVTPAHDHNDFEIAQRSGISILDVMTPGAKMNENAPEAFEGMDRFEARKLTLDLLEGSGLCAGDDPYTHSIPQCYRCHTVVEPRLSEQWFVKMKPLAEPALKASRDGTIVFTPEHWKKVYENWMENIRDWCISRQLWWGHRIPAWYCKDCDKITVARQDPDCCSFCNSNHLSQDPDVLDTWFSSWLWPFSVFGWPEDTEDLKTFYPTHDMVTAPEILFFWVARMIMAGYEFMGEAPFSRVYLHGTVRDKEGRKMSKSLGNGIDPIEVVDLFGADALRFTLISSAGVGNDIYLDHKDLEASFSTGRNFANKFWNAGRFVLMSLGDQPVPSMEMVKDNLELEDRWILSRLQRAVTNVTDNLELFRLHEVSEDIYHFVWGDFADWYLELIKIRMQSEPGDDSQQAARGTLILVMDGICRLLHPLMPFVTSELWGRLPSPQGLGRSEDLMIAEWPDPDEKFLDPDAEKNMLDFQELVTQVRSLRKEYGVSEGRGVTVRLAGLQEGFHSMIKEQMVALQRLAQVDVCEIEGAIEEGGAGAHAVLKNGAEVFIPLEGIIDVVHERKRLQVEINRLSEQMEKAQKNLANERFMQQAPPEVVEREQGKLKSFQEQADKLTGKFTSLAEG